MLPTFTRGFASLLFVIGVLLENVLADGHNPMSAPAAGDTITTGQRYTIKWSPGTSGAVSINLYDDIQQTWKSQITPSTSNSGSFIWTPDPALASRNGGTGYFLAICSLSISDCTYTYAGRFSLALAQSSSVSSASVTTSDTGGLGVGLTISTTPTTAVDLLPSSIGTNYLSGVSQTSNTVASPSDSPSTFSSPSIFPSTSQTTRSTSTSSASNSSSIIGYSTSDSIAATPVSSSQASPTDSSDKPGSLSDAAKIAIGVLASILGTALFLVGGYLLYRKRQQAKKPPCVYHAKPELDTIEKQKNYYELSGHDAYAFLYAYSAKVHELDAGRTGVIQYEKS